MRMKYENSADTFRSIIFNLVSFFTLLTWNSLKTLVGVFNQFLIKLVILSGEKLFYYVVVDSALALMRQRIGLYECAPYKSTRRV